MYLFKRSPQRHHHLRRAVALMWLGAVPYLIIGSVPRIYLHRSPLGVGAHRSPTSGETHLHYLITH